MNTQNIIISSKDEMSVFARKICKNISPDLTILLRGNMGSGKTFLSKEIISNLNNIPKDDITSPTFSITNEYRGKYFIKHTDLYRIKNINELDEIGFLDDINICINIIEWPQIVENIILKIARNYIILDIKNNGDGEARNIKLHSSFECDFLHSK